MSRISSQVRKFVNDYSVSDHYGVWGILRADQRKTIRKLCDTCDMFEKTADKLYIENKRLKEEVERLKGGGGVMFDELTLDDRSIEFLSKSYGNMFENIEPVIVEQPYNEKIFVVEEAIYCMPYHELDDIRAFVRNHEWEDIPESIQEHLEKWEEFLIDNL